MKNIKSINEFFSRGGFLSNPKKTINVNFNIDAVKKAISKISGKYKLVEEDDILNQYKFNASEFLNFGSYAIINLDEISENRTSITIEIIRKFGSFNQGGEIMKANDHISSIFSQISINLREPGHIGSEYRKLEEENKTLDSAKLSGYTEIFKTELEAAKAGKEGKIIQFMKVAHDGDIIWVGKK